jgi:hypothetical protein
VVRLRWVGLAAVSAAACAVTVPDFTLSGSGSGGSGTTGSSATGGASSTGAGGVATTSGTLSSTGGATSSSSSGTPIHVICPIQANTCQAGQVCCYKQGMTGQGMCVTTQPSVNPCPSGDIELSCNTHDDCSSMGAGVCCARWSQVVNNMRQLTGVSCSKSCTGPYAGEVCGSLSSKYCPMSTTCKPFVELQGSLSDMGYGLCE